MATRGASVGTARAQYMNHLYMGDLDQDLDIDSFEHEKERKELERTRRVREPDYIEMGYMGGR